MGGLHPLKIDKINRFRYFQITIQADRLATEGLAITMNGPHTAVGITFVASRSQIKKRIHK